MLPPHWQCVTFTLCLFACTLLYKMCQELALAFFKWLRAEPPPLTTAIYTTIPKIQDIVERITPPFTPWLFASGPVMQTFVPYILSWLQRQKIHFFDKYVLTEDGALICLNYMSFEYNTPTFVCVPGISGDKNAHYVQNFARDVCTPLGFNCVVFNKRRLAKSTYTPQRPYPTYSDVDDLAQAIQTVAEETNELYLVGFSAGANTVVKYLGGRPNNSVHPSNKIRAAFSVSNGYDIRLTMQTIPVYCNRMIALFNLRKLCADEQHLKVCSTIQEVDQHLYRCKDPVELESMYREQSCFLELPRCNTPLFLINSLDDMLFLPDANQLAIHAADINPKLILVFTNRGGHVGWLYPTRESKSSIWVNRCIRNYVECMETIDRHLLQM